jgi:site-specific recombinase XerD
MSQHRGITEGTLGNYERHLRPLLKTLGDDPSRYTPSRLRDFVAKRSKGYSCEGAKKIFTAVRMFLRYLVVEGRCPAGLEHALPRVASWSQQTLPRALPEADVERLIAACDPTTKVGIRDRAILLLLARLALRAGDIAALRFQDLCWEQGTVRVVGKSRRQALLPLPQCVGDAILAYLESGRPACESEHVFVRCCAPFRAFAQGGPISLIVRRAFQRSGVKSSCQGAHVLRHSAASEMLRQGIPLYGIAAVLRHQSIATTTLYTKIDVELLQRVAQPWPEVLEC